MSRNGTPMQRLRDRQRVSLPPERVAAVQTRRLEMQAEEAVETTLGNRPFEVVNVGGTDVKPFLDKTDGEKLVDSTGLNDEVVVTAALSTTSIRPGPPSTNAVQVDVVGLDSVGGDVNAAGASTVVSTTFDLAADGDVTLVFTVTFYFTNAETCEMALFLDFASTHSMASIRAVEGVDPTRYREIVCHDPAGGPAAVSMVTTLPMTAGSHTVLALAMAKLEPNEVVIPAGAASVEVFVR